jgi:signal peptidase
MNKIKNENIMSMNNVDEKNILEVADAITVSTNGTEIHNVIKKIISIIISFAVTCLGIIGVVVIVMNLCGFRFLTVTTGSMKNVYDVGSLIIVDSVPCDKIHEGDIISYVADEKNTIVTHRVVEVDIYNKCFYTQGDMNNVRDNSPALYENVIGRVVAGVPKIGYGIIFARSRVGLIIIVAVITIILATFIYKVISGIIRKRGGSMTDIQL